MAKEKNKQPEKTKFISSEEKGIELKEGDNDICEACKGGEDVFEIDGGEIYICKKCIRGLADFIK